MMQLPFPSTMEAQAHSVTFLTIKTVVRKIQKNNSQTGSCAWTRQCLDKGGGNVLQHCGMGAATAFAPWYGPPI